MRYYLRFDQRPSGTFGEAQTGGVYSGVDVTALARNNSSSSPVVFRAGPDILAAPNFFTI